MHFRRKRRKKKGKRRYRKKHRFDDEEERELVPVDERGVRRAVRGPVAKREVSTGRPRASLALEASLLSRGARRVALPLFSNSADPCGASRDHLNF